MILDKKNCSLSITELLLALLALLYFFGIRIWFPVCEPMADGFMACHWAGEALKALSILTLALSLVHIALPQDEIKLGMDISLLGVWVLVSCVPGGVISLCGMPQMHCRDLTQPWTVGIGAASLLLLLADTVLRLSRMNRKKHTRNTEEA